MASVKMYPVYKCEICDRFFYRPDKVLEIAGGVNFQMDSLKHNIEPNHDTHHRSKGNGIHLMKLVGLLTEKDHERDTRSCEILDQVDSIAKGYAVPRIELPGGWLEWPRTK